MRLRSPLLAAGVSLLLLAIVGPAEAQHVQAPGPVVPAACITGGDGRAVCGFACVAGMDGRAACARTPHGTCARTPNGGVTCFDPRVTVFLPPLKTTCARGADGGAACGYACVAGADGHARCADTPDGACAVGMDGRAVCTTFASDRVIVWDRNPPPPSCVRGADGGMACGYGCVVGSDGAARCSSEPRGTCTVGANGKAVCFAPAS